MEKEYFFYFVEKFEEIIGNTIQDDTVWEEYFIEFAKANSYSVLIGPDQYTLYEEGDILLCPDEHPSDLYFKFVDGYLNEVIGGSPTYSRVPVSFFYQKWDAEDDHRHYMFRDVRSR